MKKELFYTANGDWDNGIEFNWSQTDWWKNFYNSIELKHYLFLDRLIIINGELKKYNAVYFRPNDHSDKFLLTFDSEEDYLEFVMVWL